MTTLQITNELEYLKEESRLNKIEQSREFKLNILKLVLITAILFITYKPATLIIQSLIGSSMIKTEQSYLNHIRR